MGPHARTGANATQRTKSKPTLTSSHYTATRCHAARTLSCSSRRPRARSGGAAYSIPAPHAQHAQRRPLKASAGGASGEESTSLRSIRSAPSPRSALRRIPSPYGIRLELSGSHCTQNHTSRITSRTLCDGLAPALPERYKRRELQALLAPMPCARAAQFTHSFTHSTGPACRRGNTSTPW